jgi:hypothetical protein
MAKWDEFDKLIQGDEQEQVDWQRKLNQDIQVDEGGRSCPSKRLT